MGMKAKLFPFDFASVALQFHALGGGPRGNCVAHEWGTFMKQVVRYSDGDDKARPRGVEETRRLGPGRFVEATTRRLMGKIPSREFGSLSWELLQEATKPEAKEKAVALR